MAETRTTAPSVETTPPDPSDKNRQAQGLFRLPKFFTQGAEASIAEDLAELESVLPASNEEEAAHGPNSPKTARHQAAPSTGRASGDLGAIQAQLERLTEQVEQVNERESSLERVFDTLHSELSDYKNDFLYEHLKPVVRPLLFLFDSLEQFEGEIAMAEATNAGGSANAGGTLSPAVVRDNIGYFRDQLVEALRVCEVTIMEPPKGAFNAKFHKAVDVMQVEAEQDGNIVRVVRSGWFLNGQLLRPAEVVVGKFRGK